ncbi:MAG: hypothetical protein ABFD50_14065 [Smithella sp.]
MVGGVGMIEKYILVDVEQMIVDYNDNKVALESITEQYAELCEKGIGAIDYSKDRVQTTPQNDGIANEVIRGITLERQIHTDKADFIRYDKAWSLLTEKERFILTEFSIYPNREKQTAIDHICERYGIENAQVYNLKKSALLRFKRLLCG